MYRGITDIVAVQCHIFRPFKVRMKDKKQLLAVLLSMAMILSSYLPVHASEEKAVPITEAAPTNEYEHVDADET